MAQLTSRALSSVFDLCNLMRARLSKSVCRSRSSRSCAGHVFSGTRKDASQVNREFPQVALGEAPASPARFFAFLNYMDCPTHRTSHPAPPGFVFGTRPASPADFQVLQDWELLDKRRLDGRLRQLASDSYDSCLPLPGRAAQDPVGRS